MSADQSDQLHEWAGAYALGALSPDDRRRFERHLESCTRCANEVRALAPVPGLLAQITADDLEASIRPETADAIGRQVHHEGRRLRRSRNRWRVAAIIGAAAALVAATAGVAVRSDDPDVRPSVAASVTTSLAESASMSISARGWGTRIDLDLTGLPPRPLYQLWVIDADGNWSIAATWGPTPTGRAVVTGATATQASQLGRLVVTSDDRDDVIVDAMT